MSSNLIDHANRELDILGYPPLSRDQLRGKFEVKSDEDYDRMIRKAVLQIISSFAAQGHSGGSAAQVISMVTRLLKFENLAPIDDNPENWYQVDEAIAGPGIFQSKRNPALFSGDGGKTYYDLDDKRSKSAKWAGKHVPIAVRRLVWRNLNPVHMLPLKKSAHVDAD